MLGRFFTGLAAAILTLGLCAPAASQVTKAPKGYQFRIRFTPGSTIRYKTVISTSLSGHLGSFEVPMSRKVVKVHGNVADLLINQGPLRFNGKPVGTVTKIKMSIDRLGRAVGGEQSAASEVTMFPQAAIQPGRLWTASLPIAMAGISGETATVTAAYRFVKMTVYQGQRAALLSVSFTKPGGQVPMTGKGTVYILASDGNILHSTMKFRIDIQQDMQPVSVTAEVSRA